MLDEAHPWDFIYREFGIETPPFDEKPLSEYIEGYAETIPDSPALRYFNRDISFRELNELANQLANVLVDMGVGKDAVVGLHMPNMPQYVLGFLAVAKIGCAGSGVSPMLAGAELAYQISDANISVIISLDTLANSSLLAMGNRPACLNGILVTGAADYVAPSELTLPKIEGVRVESLLSVMASASKEFKQADVKWDDTYLIQYTGGTTGAPKGAMLSVRSVVRCPATQYVFAPIEPGKEICLTPFPMFHIAGAGAAVGALRFGACAILVPDPRDLDYICDQLLAEPPTYFAAVPTLLQMLLQHEKFHQIDFSKLKMAVTGAAPLSSDDRSKVEKVIGKNKLTDAFGMTETAPVYIVNPPQRLKSTALGIPVPGAEVKIVDVETGNVEMATGEHGEIITAGPHVMKGYLNLPEESAKAMREFGGKVWMYTGDVGFMDDEGYITISDRAKDMLIVGGYKVFSVEVEDKLNDLEFVANTAVVGMPDQARPGTDVVNLFVELTPLSKEREEADLKDEIIAFCRKNMSPYKIPKAVHFIDAIPLTVIGKIDKKALRKALSA